MEWNGNLEKSNFNTYSWAESPQKKSKIFPRK